ncbi:MAG TPA: hypothetical protein VMW00_03535 [Dehalococcoidales bacterium]|nr:hypothetical protein [Dehalococcoidales bacterium]
MITDPSWLYSTIAQSSAAIVAIIGGFITASVLMLTAEKRNLKNQRDDKKFYLQNKDKYILLDTRSLQILEQEITDLDARIKAFSYPTNLGWGFGTLIYLTVVGILFPVGFILTETFCLSLKILVFVLFATGLILLFFYIFKQFDELRRH